MGEVSLKKYNIELINNWDTLEIPDALFDIVGCIICLDEKVHVGKQKFCYA